MKLNSPFNPANTSNQKSKIQTSHPFFRFMLLIGLCLLGAFVFQGIGLLILSMKYGGMLLVVDTITNPSLHPALINPIKALQLVSSIGMFLIPACLFSFIQTGSWTGYIKTKNTAYSFNWILSVIAVLAALPILAYVLEWNQGLHFGILDAWVRDAELKAEIMTKAFLNTTSYAGLSFNMLVIALSAAICEEFFFRGIIQNLLKDWFKNIHVAVFVGAFIFSLFHAQMLGFFPRLLIGMLLGYLYLWSGSIWMGVLAHFVNNGLQVFLYFLQQKGLAQIDTDKADNFGIYITLVSTLIAVIALWWMYKNREVPSESTLQASIN
jgi:membrane protease YdiL (CAAX protease family)